jgi:hypothetical protein
VYDKPATPYQQLKACGILTPGDIEILDAICDPLNPAEITRRINHIQHQLISAKARTLHAKQAS